MRKWLWFLFLMTFSLPIRATTLTGTINYPNSTALTGRIFFTLSQQGAQLTTGSCGGPAVLVPTTAVIFSITAGSIQGGAAVVGNDCIAPAQTYYTVAVYDGQNNRLFSQNWIITGSTIDIGTILPVIVPQGTVAIGSAFITNLVVSGTCTGCAPTGTGSGSVTNVATTTPLGGGPITTTGTLTCTTCVAATSPGAGVAHFAGSTQTVTSSAVTPSDATGNTSGSGNFCLVTSCVMTTPNIGAATGTSLLVTGIMDGTAPVTVTTSASCTLGTTSGCNATAYKHGYTFNEDATAGAAITYTLPTAAAGLQYCVANAYNGSAANTGTLEILTSASGQYIIFTDGTLSASGGYVISGGAAADGACVVGVDSTHWFLYIQSGTWVKH